MHKLFGTGLMHNAQMTECVLYG